MAEKRKKFLVNPNFQLRFIGWMAGVALIVILIFYSAHLYFFRSYMNQGKAAGLPPHHIFFTFLSDQYRSMNWIIAITSVTVFIMIFFAGLILSHRIAGPLNRFSEHMDNCWKDKKLSKVRFRSEDYFQELAEAYNRHLFLETSENSEESDDNQPKHSKS